VSRFRHPHLTRGTVHTPRGAFEIRRGVIDAPDDVGEEYGWIRLDDEPAAPTAAPGFQLVQPIDTSFRI
jgi:hypothetical protein